MGTDEADGVHSFMYSATAAPSSTAAVRTGALLPLFEPFLCYNRSSYQDRLGTNTAEGLKQEAFCCSAGWRRRRGHQHAALHVDDDGRV